MREIRFFVPGVPVAQPRQRHAIKRTKTGKSFVQNYTEKGDPVNAFKAAARLVASQARRGGVITGPVLINVEWIFPRTKGQMWARKPMPRLRHTKKPDLDNLSKGLWDSLKGIIWVDDAQVCDEVSQKWIASGDEQPGVYVTIQELPEATNG